MKINKQIRHLAIPNIISNLSVPLLSSVDTALVGHLPQSYFIGAVAVGGMIFNFIYWGFGFLRMGTTGLTAQAYGRKDDLQMRLIFARALLVAVISGILLICPFMFLHHQCHAAGGALCRRVFPDSYSGCPGHAGHVCYPGLVFR